MPTLRAAQQQQTSIGVSTAGTALGSAAEDMTVYPAGGVWEDDEEQKFYEDLPDLADFLPRNALGIQASDTADEDSKTNEESRKNEEAELLEKLNQEIADLENESKASQDRYEAMATGSSTSPRPGSPATESVEPENTAAAAPSQIVTNILNRLSDINNRESTDQVAIDFAFVNSKAARKRLVKVCAHWIALPA
jgi:regulator of nonsense transcripts 2